MIASDPFHLQRFVDAQEPVFDAAMSELRSGSKESHWMWFIFPQLAELGQSPTSQYYGIASFDEAAAFLEHPLLSARLAQSIKTLEPWAGKRSPEQLLGAIDAKKLRSSLTLFDRVQPDDIFDHALASFFEGARDERTLALLNRKQ